jgi:hypothetical protein
MSDACNTSSNLKFIILILDLTKSWPNTIHMYTGVGASWCEVCTRIDSHRHT